MVIQSKDIKETSKTQIPILNRFCHPHTSYTDSSIMRPPSDCLPLVKTICNISCTKFRRSTTQDVGVAQTCQSMLHGNGPPRRHLQGGIQWDLLMPPTPKSEPRFSYGDQWTRGSWSAMTIPPGRKTTLEGGTIVENNKITNKGFQ